MFPSKKEVEVARLAKLVRIRDKAAVRRAKGPIDIPWRFDVYGNGKGRLPVPKELNDIFEDGQEVEIIPVKSIEELEALLALGDLHRFPYVLYIPKSKENSMK